MENLDLNESVKSSEYTGSGEPYKVSIPDITTESEVNDEKEKIIKLSNDSILHGYDMAIEIVAGHGNTEAVRVLAESRSAIEVGLHNGIKERIKGNFGTHEDSTTEEYNTSK